jgi:MFS transporter, DHA2 family, multidrug resistance protein
LIAQAPATPAPAMAERQGERKPTALSLGSVRPYIGILGVFLGAALATLNGRLLSVGLADLRGARGFGFDQASWIPTALNMAMMFSGVFVIFVNTVLGLRRILLPCAAIFTCASALLALAPNYWSIVALVVVAGISSGTFYSLTMTFVLTALPKRLIIFGIAAYAADIVFVSNVASGIEGWYMEHLSWHWIFWNAAVFTPLMILCVHIGVPRQPLGGLRPSWRGFAYFSVGFSLLYGALDQGQRLYWFHSGTIVAMTIAGLVLVIASISRRLIQPNPTLNLSFLNTRNIVILALSIFVFRFVHLASVVLVPAFLGTIQGYRPLETGHALAWVAVPMLAVVWLVAFLIIHANSRLVMSVGLTIAAVACWFCARVDSSWAGTSFAILELVLAVGFACSYIGMVASLVLEALEAGAMTSAANAATFSGFLHFIRLFGGEIGAVAMTRFIDLREQFHSNLLGLHVDAGDWQTVERLQALAAGLFPGSVGLQEAQQRAVGILNQQVKAQAYTLAIGDAFILIAWTVVGYLLLMLFLKPGKFSFKLLRRMK